MFSCHITEKKERKSVHMIKLKETQERTMKEKGLCLLKHDRQTDGQNSV